MPTVDFRNQHDLHIYILASYLPADSWLICGGSCGRNTWCPIAKAKLRSVWRSVCRYFPLKQCIIKQSIDSLSLIYGIINVEESVMSHNFTKCYEKDPKCKLVYSNIFLITEIECIIYDVHSMKWVLYLYRRFLWKSSAANLSAESLQLLCGSKTLWSRPFYFRYN